MAPETAMTKQELEYKICLLDLLIAIDEDIVDWRGYPKLWEAIRKADTALDLWAGMNLKQIRDDLLKQMERMTGETLPNTR